MAVIGQRAKGVGVKKPKQITRKNKTPQFKQYETQGSSSAAVQARSKSGRQGAPSIRGIKSILANYRATAPRPSGGNPAPTRRIAPNKITRLKQQRATEASEAQLKSYKKAPDAPKKIGGQAKQMARSNKNRATSFVVREKAPSRAPGKYLKVQAATLNKSDYRKDQRTFTATERRNKQVNDSRQRAARKKK
jgi:hypothetical protein